MWFVLLDLWPRPAGVAAVKWRYCSDGVTLQRPHKTWRSSPLSAGHAGERVECHVTCTVHPPPLRRPSWVRLQPLRNKRLFVFLHKHYFWIRPSIFNTAQSPLLWRLVLTHWFYQQIGASGTQTLVSVVSAAETHFELMCVVFSVPEHFLVLLCQCGPG